MIIDISVVIAVVFHDDSLFICGVYIFICLYFQALKQELCFAFAVFSNVVCLSNHVVCELSSVSCHHVCLSDCRDRINTVITALELSGNHIGDAGAAALTDALRCVCIS